MPAKRQGDHKKLTIIGAREHNLKAVNLELPRNSFIVFTGISGSGKSSLAFDTIYAEGQRRYVESLSSYARQFLDQLPKPEVEHIEGLSPAISIEQKGISKNPRSTVGTVTEIYDYLRLLYANLGVPHCYRCGRPIQRQRAEQMVERIMEFPPGTRLMIMAPVVRGRKGEYGRLFEKFLKEGFVRALVDGKLYQLDQPIKLKKTFKHNISLIVDRLAVTPELQQRMVAAVRTALKKASGLVEVTIVNYPAGHKEDRTYFLFSEKYSCPDCGVSVGELAPRMFSFNSPFGACPHCKGLGYVMEPDEGLIIPDKTKSLSDGAIKPWEELFLSAGQGADDKQRLVWRQIKSIIKSYKIKPSLPFYKLPRSHRDVLLHGTDYAEQSNKRGSKSGPFSRPEFGGVISWLKQRLDQAEYEDEEEEILQYYAEKPCPKCHGQRLRPESLAVKFKGLNIYQFAEMSVKSCQELLGSFSLSQREAKIAEPILKEISDRLQFLEDVGLSYLSLNRRANTLAGGEAQRIRLATQVGTKLVGVLYILDEPSIGLHQRDNRRLISTLKKLRDLGNTIIVVEHDETTIRSADFVVDLGPGAGEMGGTVVIAGPPDLITRDSTSITGRYLAGTEQIPVPEERRQPKPGYALRILGAQQYNLKDINVEIPLGLMVCISGVSGSGKSTLIVEILYAALARRFYKSQLRPGEHRAILGVEHLNRVVDVDQSPIGRTPRSNPATYTGLFTPIRELFEKLPESRRRGYKKGRFSFNVKAGRCPHCKGQGTIKVEMHFLPNVYVTCEECGGKRYNRETLGVYYKGKNIAEVLDMTVAEALEFFKNIPIIRHKLQTLYDVGLGYIAVGQSATTLSGGEAQRIKLTRELAKKHSGTTLYILDEPTTGLHFDDIKKLLAVLNRLVNMGNTVIIIEHNLDVIKCADYIIDLGPEGGEDGGYVIATGTPEQITRFPDSYTGYYLRDILSRQLSANQKH